MPILPEVRDPRMFTIRRGGTRIDEHHHLLALRAAECPGHVLPLFASARPEDARPGDAIDAARRWARGELAMMQARALGGHLMGAARPLTGASRFAAYAAGQAQATEGSLRTAGSPVRGSRRARIPRFSTERHRSAPWTPFCSRVVPRPT